MDTQFDPLNSSKARLPITTSFPDSSFSGQTEIERAGPQIRESNGHQDILQIGNGVLPEAGSGSELLGTKLYEDAHIQPAQEVNKKTNYVAPDKVETAAIQLIDTALSTNLVTVTNSFEKKFLEQLKNAPQQIEFDFKRSNLNFTGIDKALVKTEFALLEDGFRANIKRANFRDGMLAAAIGIGINAATDSFLSSKSKPGTFTYIADFMATPLALTVARGAPTKVALMCGLHSLGRYLDS